MELKVINTWFCESLIGAGFVEFWGVLIIFVGYFLQRYEKNTNYKQRSRQQTNISDFEKAVK